MPENESLTKYNLINYYYRKTPNKRIEIGIYKAEIDGSFGIEIHSRLLIDRSTRDIYKTLVFYSFDTITTILAFMLQYIDEPEFQENFRDEYLKFISEAGNECT